MHRYILDATAVIALEDDCNAGSFVLDDVLDYMTTLAINGSLICPRLAIDQCRKLGSSDPGTRWVRTASGHFDDTEESWEYYDQVLDSCNDLVDPDDLEENPQVGVLASALKHRDGGYDVTVVTAQWENNPLQRSQGSAASMLNIPAISMRAFLNAIPADELI